MESREFSKLKKRIQSEAADLSALTDMGFNAATGSVQHLMENYGFTFRESVLYLRRQNDIPERAEEYDPVDKYELWMKRPPKVDDDDWKQFGQNASSYDVSSEIVGDHCTQLNQVYVLQLDIRGWSLQDAEQQAKVILGETPSWLKRAWRAHYVFYVGQSGDLRKRLKTHASGTFNDYPPPANLTVLSDVIAGGVVKAFQSTAAAEEFEENYGQNLRDISADNDEVFVYHA